AHGVFDHRGDEFRSLGWGESVGVGEQAELAGALGGGRELVAGGDVVVVESGVEPGDLGDLVEAVEGARELPVDEADRPPVTGHDVPGSEVAVAAYGIGARRAGEPR